MRRIRIPLLMLLLAGPVGCASTSPALPAGEGEPVDLGRIGVVLAEYRPDTQIGTPPGRLQAAAQGAGRGALTVLQIGGASGNGVAALAAIALAPVGAGIGALFGAGLAEPVPDRGQIEETIQQAVRAVDIGAQVRDVLLRISGVRGLGLVDLGEEMGPLSPEDRPGYGRLAQRGIDTVLEIRVSALALTARPRDDALAYQPNPLFDLAATATARLVRTADGSELISKRVEEDGGSAAFAEWGADDARAVREGLGKISEGLAEAIAGTLLDQPGQGAAPPAHASPPPDDPWAEQW